MFILLLEVILMNNFIMAYLFISVIIGAFYFKYWYNTLQPSEVLYTTPAKRLFIYSAVILMSMALAPISLIDLIKNLEKRKEEKL